jgi:hypothetical protein
MSMEKNDDSWCTAECMGIHAVNRATRFVALEPIRLGVRAWPDRCMELHVLVSTAFMAHLPAHLEYS